MSEAFQSPHTPGPVANESASASTCNNSNSTGSPSSASTTPEMTLGSCRSRRVAVWGTAGGSARSWTAARRRRATAPAGCRSASPGRHRCRCGPRRVPCRCRAQSAEHQQSGRDTRVVNALARETVSTRWRSTVQMWTTSRGGRSRTAPHSGNSLPHSPVRSSASIVATAGGPAASITSRSLSAGRGQGVRSSGAASDNRPALTPPSEARWWPTPRRRAGSGRDRVRVAHRGPG